jgi:hypothetical protein
MINNNIKIIKCMKLNNFEYQNHPSHQQYHQFHNKNQDYNHLEYQLEVYNKQINY